MMRLLTLLKSKIHHAIMTDADYVGSITIDHALISHVGLVPGGLPPFSSPGG